MKYVKSLFSGRVNEGSYYKGVTPLTLIQVGILFYFYVFFTRTIYSVYVSTSDFLISHSLVFILYAVCHFYSYSLMVRRLHDINRPGTNLIGLAIPIYGLLFVGPTIWYKKGSTGKNKYGLPNKEKSIVKIIFFPS